MTTHQPGLSTSLPPQLFAPLPGCYPFSKGAAECEYPIARTDVTGKTLWLPCKRTDGSCSYCAKIHRKSVYRSTRLFAEDQAASGKQLWFVTLTGPGFGQVHRPEHCPCGRSHADDAEAWVGAPIDSDNYDYDSHRTWNLGLAKLMTATTRRMKRAGWEHVRVLEMQRRQVAHFHLLVAVAPDVGLPDLVKLFAETSCAMTDSMTGERSTTRWGPQVDVRPLGDDVSKAAGYVAKYVAKPVTSRSYEAVINEPRTPLELHVAAIYSNSLCDCDSDGEQAYGPGHWLTCTARQHHRQGGARSRPFWSSVPSARLAARQRERVAEAERLRELSGVAPLPPLPPVSHVEAVRPDSELYRQRQAWWPAYLEWEHQMLTGGAELPGDVVAAAGVVVDAEYARVLTIMRGGSQPDVIVTDGLPPRVGSEKMAIPCPPDEWPPDIDLHGLDDPQVWLIVPRAPPDF